VCVCLTVYVCVSLLCVFMPVCLCVSLSVCDSLSVYALLSVCVSVVEPNKINAKFLMQGKYYPEKKILAKLYDVTTEMQIYASGKKALQIAQDNKMKSNYQNLEKKIIVRNEKLASYCERNYKKVACIVAVYSLGYSFVNGKTKNKPYVIPSTIFQLAKLLKDDGRLVIERTTYNILESRKAAFNAIFKVKEVITPYYKPVVKEIDGRDKMRDCYSFFALSNQGLGKICKGENISKDIAHRDIQDLSNNCIDLIVLEKVKDGFRI